MPDNTDPTTPVTSHETIVDTKSSQETLDSNGNSLPVNSNLSAIFDKIESGVDRKDAVKEVMSKKASLKPEKKEEVPAEKHETKEIKVVSSHPDKKDDETPASNLDEAFTKGQQKKDADAEGKKEEKVFESTKADEEIPEEELQVLPHDKPKTAKRISALLQKIAKVTEEATTTKKERDERDAKLKELETQLATVKTVDPKTEEEIAGMKKELNMHRRRYDLDKDPEVKQKFDSRIEKASAEIDAAMPEMLKKNNAGEGLIALIKEEGGWSKFSKSGRIVALAGGEKVTASDLADQIVGALPFSDRKVVDAITMEQISVKRERERFLEAEIKAADEFFKTKDQEAAKGTEDYQKMVKDAEQTIKKWQDKVAVENAFLKEKEIPANASAEEKKSIAEENEHAKTMNAALKKNLNTKDLDGMLNIVLEAVQFHQEKRQSKKLADEVSKLKAELKAKSEELDRVKTSGKTTTKGGSLTGGGSIAPSSKAEKPKTLEAAFDMLASARGSAGNDE